MELEPGVGRANAVFLEGQRTPGEDHQGIQSSGTRLHPAKEPGRRPLVAREPVEEPEGEKVDRGTVGDASGGFPERPLDRSLVLVEQRLVKGPSLPLGQGVDVETSLEAPSHALLDEGDPEGPGERPPERRLAGAGAPGQRDQHARRPSAPHPPTGLRSANTTGTFTSASTRSPPLRAGAKRHARTARRAASSSTR